MSQQENSQSAHKRGVFETRELCRNLFYQLPPELDNHSSIDPPDSQIMLTRALLEYHSDIAVKRSVLGNTWNTDDPLDIVRTLPPMATVSVPMDRITPAGDVELNFEPISRVKLAKKPVKLDSLQEEWGIKNQARVRVHPEGNLSKTVSERRYTLALPPRSARLVKAALDDCIDELGWTEQATEKDEHAVPI